MSSDEQGSVGLQQEQAQLRRSSALQASSNAPQRVRLRRSRSSPTAGENSPARGRGPQNSSPGLTKSPSNLHTFDTLPEYLRDNEFIHTGYRYNLPMKDTLRSLFDYHNETGNVWSHLIGFFLFLFLTMWIMRTPPTPLLFSPAQLDQLWHSVAGSMGQVGDNLHSLQHQLQDSLNSGMHTLEETMHSLQEHLSDSVTSLQGGMSSGAAALASGFSHLQEGLSQQQSDLLQSFAAVLSWPVARWPTYVFCAGACTCLLLSAFCHLMGCCQKHVALLIWRLDYAGIAVLIVTSFYPPVYYGFMCQPAWAAFYLSVTTLLGVGTVAVALLEKFQQPEWRATRAAMFTGLGMFGIVPILHQLWIHYQVWHVRTAVLYDVFMGLSYVAGAVIFATRVPERFWPGKFDMWLNSHQIFHLAVVAGAYIHWRAVLLLLEWRDASGGCAVPGAAGAGPTADILHQMRAKGHDLLHIDQVWDALRQYAAQHLWNAAGLPGPAGEGAGSGGLASGQEL